MCTYWPVAGVPTESDIQYIDIVIQLYILDSVRCTHRVRHTVYRYSDTAAYWPVPGVPTESDIQYIDIVIQLYILASARCTHRVRHTVYRYSDTAVHTGQCQVYPQSQTYSI